MKQYSHRIITAAAIKSVRVAVCVCVGWTKSLLLCRFVVGGVDVLSGIRSICGSRCSFRVIGCFVIRVCVHVRSVRSHWYSDHNKFVFFFLSLMWLLPLNDYVLAIQCTETINEHHTRFIQTPHSIPNRSFGRSDVPSLLAYLSASWPIRVVSRYFFLRTIIPLAWPTVICMRCSSAAVESSEDSFIEISFAVLCVGGSADGSSHTSKLE